MAKEVGEKKDNNVFISWSGDRSEAIATALHKWIPQFIQSVKPWMSKPDMTKGRRWGVEMGERLEQTSVGIICLTPENLDVPWILFEAGTISKEMRDSRTCTYLFDLDYTDIKGPLAQFQHTQAEKEDTKKLLNTINAALGATEGVLLVEQGILDEAFETFWPKLEKALKNVPPPKAKPPKRTQEDKIDDILTVVRRLEKESISPIPPHFEPWATVRSQAGEYFEPNLGHWDRYIMDRIFSAQQARGTVTEPVKPEGDEKAKDKEDKDE